MVFSRSHGTNSRGWQSSVAIFELMGDTGRCCAGKWQPGVIYAWSHVPSGPGAESRAGRNTARVTSQSKLRSSIGPGNFSLVSCLNRFRDQTVFMGNFLRFGITAHDVIDVVHKRFEALPGDLSLVIFLT